MKILNRQQIEQLLTTIDPMPLIEQGFVQYTQGLATLPPFGKLLLDKGEVHVKYGYIKSDDYYVIKVASDLTKNQHSYHRGRV